MSKLTCTNVVKQYKGTKALDSLSVTFSYNKIYGLVGRNGAGKTTLLKAIAGQIVTTSGSITLNGTEVFENQQMLDEICLARGFSSAALMGRKIKDIMNAAKLFYRYWDEDFAARLLKKFDIDMKKPYIKLSSGMQSAVNITIGLASRAPFTMLDEPTAGLDVVSRDYFYQMLLDDYMQNPRTFIISTHLIEETASIFEDMIFINRGKVLLEENTDVLKDRYRYVSGKTELVESFIRGMEVLHREGMGAKLTACVRHCATTPVPEGLEVKEVPIQKLFVYLTTVDDKEEDAHASR